MNLRRIVFCIVILSFLMPGCAIVKEKSTNMRQFIMSPFEKHKKMKQELAKVNDLIEQHRNNIKHQTKQIVTKNSEWKKQQAGDSIANSKKILKSLKTQKYLLERDLKAMEPERTKQPTGGDGGGGSGGGGGGC